MADSGSPSLEVREHRWNQCSIAGKSIRPAVQGDIRGCSLRACVRVLALAGVWRRLRVRSIVKAPVYWFQARMYPQTGERKPSGRCMEGRPGALADSPGECGRKAIRESACSRFTATPRRNVPCTLLRRNPHFIIEVLKRPNAGGELGDVKILCPGTTPAINTPGSCRHRFQLYDHAPRSRRPCHVPHGYPSRNRSRVSGFATGKVRT